MILKKHIPEIHDIHTYNPQAVYQQTDGRQNGFNPNCQGRALDWSGVSLRNRSFCRMCPFNIPGAFSEPIVESDINFWNTCNPCAVLISPKHALICQHYRGTHDRPNETHTFLGKNGQRHTRKVVNVTLNVGSDHTLLEFESEFPEDVKVYNKIAAVEYIPEGYDIWMHDCNSKCIKISMGKAHMGISGPTGYTWNPVLDGVNNGINTDGNLAIFVGDSGTPSFVIDQYGNTILIGLMFGGSQINKMELDNINSIINPQGYSIVHTKIAAKAADLNQDGKIDGQDLAILFASWANGDMMNADINMDGVVDSEDLSHLLSEWGDYTIIENVKFPFIGITQDNITNTKPRQ